MKSTTEVWKAIPGYEELYMASSYGQIKSLDHYGRHGKGFALKRGIILKQTANRCGYLVVGLCNNGVSKQYSVHCLVIMAFEGERPKGMDVCHGDGDRRNNYADNLRYDTKFGNAADKRLHGTNNEGDTNPRAKLVADEVIEIYRRCISGESQKSIAEELNINPITVNHIATGRTWSSVTGSSWGRAHVTITGKIVLEIDRLQKSGDSIRQISLKLGISTSSAFRHSKDKKRVLEREGALCLAES